MATAQAKHCSRCATLESALDQQQAEIHELRAEVQKLQAEVGRLREELARARKDSSNSSKPPSSDIVKPPPKKPKGKRKRKKGGQPGHPRHERPPFAPEEIDQTVSHELDCCPDCGHDLEPADAAPRVVQQMIVVEKPVVIVEHRGPAYWCQACQKVHYAPIPEAVSKAGLISSDLMALIAFLKGVCHMSFSTIRKYLRDVVGRPVCRGLLAKVLAKVTKALDRPYEELLQALPQQPALNVDETGHKDNGKAMWTWCFRAQLYTLFRIDPSRSAQVLMDVLGAEFEGVLGCDYFGAYRRYMRECNVLVQFCLAHLIRDVKFLMTLPDRRQQAYGERLRDALRALFRVIHRREEMSTERFEKALDEACTHVYFQATERVPRGNHAQNMAQRFIAHGEAYFQFLTTPGIEPTNNLAEQAIRFVVIDRHITQGTRSEVGQRWSERIWTVIATCAQHGRSVYEYLRQAIRAYFDRTPAPSLLFNTS